MSRDLIDRVAAGEPPGGLHPQLLPSLLLGGRVRAPWRIPHALVMRPNQPTSRPELYEFSLCSRAPDYPMVSLENNVTERMITGPVVTKRTRGSHIGDTARNAAVLWTVTGTAQMASLNILTFLTAYLDECGCNRGKPLTGPELERFLPWNASPEDLRT